MPKTPAAAAPKQTPAPPKKNGLFIAGSALLALANNIAIQKWGAQWPDSAVWALYGLALLSFAIGAFRYEQFFKAGAKVGEQVKQHPVSLAILFILVVIASCSSIKVMQSRQAQARDKATAVSVLPKLPPKPDEPGTESPQGALPGGNSQQQPAATAKATPKKGFDPQKYGLKEVHACPPGSNPFTVDNSSMIVNNKGWAAAMGPNVCVLIDNHSYIKGFVCDNCGVQPCSKFYPVPGCPPIPEAKPQSTSPPNDVTQSGIGNQQTLLQTPVTQQNSGGCNQQVVGGNNNTNTCAPQPVSVSLDQASLITKKLKETPGLRGTVRVEYEFSAEGGEVATERLKKAFSDAGLSVEGGGSGTIFAMCPPRSLPGLSFKCLNKNDPLTVKIIEALRDAGVITWELEESPKQPLEFGANSFVSIVIRRP